VAKPLAEVTAALPESLLAAGAGRDLRRQGIEMLLEGYGTKRRCSGKNTAERRWKRWVGASASISFRTSGSPPKIQCPPPGSNR
jgi:hypothetical protein